MKTCLPAWLFVLGTWLSVPLIVASAAQPAAMETPSLPLPTPGRDYFVLRGGLDNSRIKFVREKRGRVAFLGGSITNMKGWRELVGRELERRFPETKFDFVNAGIPSLGSVPGTFRFSRDVLANGPVDLLFEEAAVNDDVNGASETDQRRSMEGIVRQARLTNPAIDVVLLYLVDPPKMKLIREGKRPPVIVTHDAVAAHYQLPAIDLAREVTERIDAGQFTWEKDFKDLHPSPFGHAVYLRSIARLFDAAWQQPLSSSAVIRPYALPRPLDAHSYFKARLASVRAAALGEGWTLVERWKPTDVPSRPGFGDIPAAIAEQPGAVLRLKFNGNAAGIFCASGPDTGIIEWQVDGGAWQRLDLYTQWSARLHLPWAQVLASGLPTGAHELTLRVSADRNPNSKGHAIRILHFLVNGE